MTERHKMQAEDKRRAFETQIQDNFFKWEKLIENIKLNGEEKIKIMTAEHQQQLMSKRIELDELLPIKLKESSELLN